MSKPASAMPNHEVLVLNVTGDAWASFGLPQSANDWLRKHLWPKIAAGHRALESGVGNAYVRVWEMYTAWQTMHATCHD